MFPYPVPWPRWCPGEHRDISGVFRVAGTDTWYCVSQFLIQNPKIPLVPPGLEPGIGWCCESESGPEHPTVLLLPLSQLSLPGPFQRG